MVTKISHIYVYILQYRFMISLFFINEVYCISVKMYLNIFGEHAINCKEFPDFKYKLDFIRDATFYIYRRTKVFVKNEAPVSFLFYLLVGRSTLRSAYVMMCRWVSGKHVYERIWVGIHHCAIGDRELLWWDQLPLKPCQTNDQTWKNVRCFYIICVWHIYLYNTRCS